MVANLINIKANKAAFDEVLGDPFADPEKDGWYNIFKWRGVIGSARYSDDGHTTATPGRPSQTDFFVDVENIVKRIVGQRLIDKFANTYMLGETEEDKILTGLQRDELEQRIGRAFRVHGISPVSQYFTTVRIGSVR